MRTHGHGQRSPNLTARTRRARIAGTASQAVSSRLTSARPTHLLQQVPEPAATSGLSATATATATATAAAGVRRCILRIGGGFVFVVEGEEDRGSRAKALRATGVFALCRSRQLLTSSHGRSSVCSSSVGGHESRATTNTQEQAHRHPRAARGGGRGQ